ncbi:hypothetical protein [Streptomyces fructofermentans]|uniref:Uncharacterized protein n=1 Tax=Streptomyces fructofermentans TaxID=152141 RepID=A0A918K8G9_9ACTN|nr:hypothetical protein [Streptomyces fructofermentans]GGX54757.1 hypothetical protein GCM10010515_22630 [Streptomyces fructofermentans]
MANERVFRCFTCRTYEAHRPPAGEPERRWLRELTGKKYVDDYWMCTRGECRNVRYAWDDDPFDPPLRMPEFD